MNNFKKLLFCSGLIVIFTLKTDDACLSRVAYLKDSIKRIQAIIADATRNLYSLKRLLALEQYQLAEASSELPEEEEQEEDNNEEDNNDYGDDDHRLTLRLPKRLLAKIDKKRKQRIGRISRNLWILETIEKAVM